MTRIQVGDGEEPVLLKVPQAANLLQTSENTVHSLISQNLIPHTRFGKLIRIPRWGPLQFIAQTSGAPLPSLSERHAAALQSVDATQHDEEAG